MGEVSDGNLRRVTIHQTRGVTEITRLITRLRISPGGVRRIPGRQDLHGSQMLTGQELSTTFSCTLFDGTWRGRSDVIIRKHPKLQGIVQIGSIVPVRRVGVPINAFIRRVIQDHAIGDTLARIREAAENIPVPHGAWAFMMFMRMTVVRTVAVTVAVLMVMTVIPNRALVTHSVETDGTTPGVLGSTALGIVNFRSMVMLRAPMYPAGRY